MLRGRRIIFFVTEEWYFCSHRLPLARAAAKAGMDVKVITRLRKQTGQIREAGISPIHLETDRSGLNPIKDFKLLFRLIRILRQQQPDILHNVAMKPCIYGSIAARITGVPAVVNAIAGMGYAFTETGLRATVTRAIIRAGLKCAFRHRNAFGIFQNSSDRDFFIKSGMIASKKSVLIRGAGVDIRKFHPAARALNELSSGFRGKKPRVVLHARMLATKGIHEFAQAASMLENRGVDVDMILAGAPDPANPASIPEEVLVQWHRQGICTWLGEIEDIPSLLARADISCLPTYREGLPKSLLEAAASGLPIVATDIPGCRAVARHGVNALLVPCRDARAVAGAIERLLTDHAMRRKMGEASRKIAVTEFSEEKVTEDTLDTYRRAVAATGAAG